MRALLALGFQGFFMMVCVAIYAVLVNTITVADNIHTAIWSVAATLMIIVMLPFFFFAMYERDGFPAEKILLHVINQKFRRPGIRAYQSENLYDRLIEQSKIEKEGARLEKKAREAREARNPFRIPQKADRKK